jgi:hypothetical protein
MVGATDGCFESVGEDVDGVEVGRAGVGSIVGHIPRVTWYVLVPLHDSPQ